MAVLLPYFLKKKEFELYELSGNRGKKIRAGFRRE
jgi:hypothetical protein